MSSHDTFSLSADELRVVARFAVESAEQALPIFESHHEGDARPRAAIEAAWAFVNGAARSNLQRVTAHDAHRAAKDATLEITQLAARSAGDAAAAANLHPIAQASQVGHILRSTALVARVAELQSEADPTNAGLKVLEQAGTKASRELQSILVRYPRFEGGSNRVDVLTRQLDSLLRSKIY